MQQMREMNKSIFYNNLMMTIYEIVDAKKIDGKSIRIKIIPVYSMKAGKICIIGFCGRIAAWLNKRM